MGNPTLGSSALLHRLSIDGGVVVESGRPGDVLSNPQHQRTQAFLSKVL